MLRKIFVIVMSMALFLAACAQAAPQTPYRATVVPTQSSDKSPDQAAETPETYPDPPQAAVAVATEPAAYPEPGNDAEKITEVENLALEKGLNTDFAPQESDLELVAGPAYVEADSSKITVAADDPSAVEIYLTGNLPNPCSQLRVLVREPNEEGRIEIVVYSVADAEKMCTQVLQPFEETISLKNVPAGKYSVHLNDIELGPIEVK